MSQVRHTFGKHWRLFILILAVVLFFWVSWLLRSALFPFIIGLALAYILLPVINWAETRLPRRDRWRRAKRVLLILFIFLAILALAASLGFYLFITIVNAATELARTVPDILRNVQAAIEDWTQRFREQLPPGVQDQLDQAIRNLGTQLGTILLNAFRASLTVIPTTIGFFVGLAALPIFLFYMLKDWDVLKNGFYAGLPPWAAQHIRNVLIIVGTVLGGYIRAELILGLAIGTMSLVVLLILGIPYAPVLALVAGVSELIPILGPWIGGAVASIVALALVPEKLLWVVISAVIIQLLENNLLVPRIQGQILKVHPAIAIVLLVVGAYLAGIWGIVLAIPLASTGVALYRYFTHVTTTEDVTRPGGIETP